MADEHQETSRSEGASSGAATCSADRFRLAAINTYKSLHYLEEWEGYVRDATILIVEIMRGEVNPEDECEKFLRDRAPKMLAAHYEENV